MAGKETTGRLALAVNSQTFGWLRNEFLALGWKNRNDEILQGQVQKSSIFCNFFAKQTTPTILLTLYPLEICAIRWGPMANIPGPFPHSTLVQSPLTPARHPKPWTIALFPARAMTQTPQTNGSTGENPWGSDLEKGDFDQKKMEVPSGYLT